ncbi:MAG: hypothetical protein M0R03_23475 [Novosphingobium sp.]|jgi:hypothetical protein|nr:hypothetical protein [Novosphingobium sp.]MDD5355019.1 hypothetical protein [Candidatus Omnitrophota bacterium]
MDKQTFDTMKEKVGKMVYIGLSLSILAQMAGDIGKLFSDMIKDQEAKNNKEG